MELKTRRVEFAGLTANPDTLWITQIARNLTDAHDDFLNGKRYVLMDRDGKFCSSFQKILKDDGATPLLLPPRSPNLNTWIERFFRSLKSECVDSMNFFCDKSLRRAVRAYLSHYHAERNHQGLTNELIDPGEEVGAVAGKIQGQERLGGMLRYYYRDAA